VILRFLLDADIISEPLKPKPDENIINRLREHQGELGIASVVWHELRYGCYRLPKSVRRTAIETYLFEVVAPSIDILPYDEQAANWHAAERARLTKLGRTPPFADAQLAAIAAVSNLILATFNTGNYEDFQDVLIEDWRGS
jgi:tRNA(fMet)-specific endonuclease VapC